MTEHIQATPVNASTVLGVLVDGDTTLTANTDFITVTSLATVTLPDAALPGKAIRIVADGADATLNAAPHLIFNADAGAATFVVPDGSAVDIVRSTSLDWFIASGGGGTGGLSDLVPLNVNGTVASAGVALLASRADHKHDIDVAVPVSVGTANAAGTSISLARSDHVHAGVALSAVAPVDVTKAAAAVGVATTAARSDHKHDVTTAVPVAVGVANAQGTATTLARSDHVHAGVALTAVAPVDVTKAAAVVGVATAAARADHKHDISTAVPVSVGVTNAEGTATTLARSDHVHAGGGSGSVVSTDQALLGVDYVNATLSFTTILSIVLTVPATPASVRVDANAFHSSQSTNITDYARFRLVVDGAALLSAGANAMGSAQTVPTAPTCVSLLWQGTLPPGAHTITFEAACTNAVAGGGSVSISAALDAQKQSAALVGSVIST